MNKLILFFIFSLIFLTYIKRCIDNFTNTFKFDKIYCINLLKNKNRWTEIQKLGNVANLDIYRFDAVDCTSFEKSKKYHHLLTNSSKDRLNLLEKNKYRKLHAELSPGAIGCYLSHYNIWKDIVHNKYVNTLILEDDANIPSDFTNKYNNYIKDAPEDWDMIFLGYINNKSSSVNEKYIKLKKLYRTHAYIINQKGAQKLIDLMIPINYQIDSQLSDLSDKINIYGTLPELIKSSDAFVTDIQMPIK
jgi:collagen beta-1,O-galactosyltransferase